MTTAQFAQSFIRRDLRQVLEDGEKCKPRRKIIGAFLYEDTTTLLFSRTNFGKSILAFQFAYAAVTGTHFAPCPALMNECEPMKVAVIDFELDEKMIMERHRKCLFHQNLDNVVYFHEQLEFKVKYGFELLKIIEEQVVEEQAKLVIIDNITRLLPDSRKPLKSTMLVSMLNRIRAKTGAAILVIGHTTKGNPAIGLQSVDYYGSAMIQNFFTEITYLDRTRTDKNKFFLCHAKTKQKECYDRIVPVFSRGEHLVTGLGFSFTKMRPLHKVQLPLQLEEPAKQRARNLSRYRRDILFLIEHGYSQHRIAAMFNVNQSSISRIVADT